MMSRIQVASLLFDDGVSNVNEVDYSHSHDYDK